MKYILSLLLVCTISSSFGQITLNDMMKIYNMDYDQFETYALVKGYQFHRIKDDENIFQVAYKKGKDIYTKYILLASKMYTLGRCVTYQTALSKEFLQIKTELINQDFKLIKTETSDGSISKTYANKTWKVETYNTEGMMNNEPSGIQVFEINLYKL